VLVEAEGGVTPAMVAEAFEVPTAVMMVIRLMRQ
jgi:hypothetical protein